MFVKGNMTDLRERSVKESRSRTTKDLVNGEGSIRPNEKIKKQQFKDSKTSQKERKDTSENVNEPGFWERIYGKESQESFETRKNRVINILKDRRDGSPKLRSPHHKFKVISKNQNGQSRSSTIMNHLLIGSILSIILYGGFRMLFDKVNDISIHTTMIEYQNRVRRSHEEFMLDPMDLLVGLPVPTKPLNDLPPIKFRKFEDTFPYQDQGENAQHGRLAYGFEHKNMPKFTRSLNRIYPDYRDNSCKTAPFYTHEVVSELPSASVVIVFADEPFETLMRSVHSVLNRTPSNLLKEIILVNDASSKSWVQEYESLLESYLGELPKVFLVKNENRQGIMRSRTQGILQTTSDIFIVLDSHIEVQPGWIEPLVHRIQEEPFAFVTPLIDSILYQNNYEPQMGGIPCHLGMIWRLQDHAFTPIEGISPPDRTRKITSQYTSSPVMAGGLFAASKETFIAVGGYDLGMTGWGAENVEMGFRLWMCGARLDCMECSRVGHIFDRGQTYKEGLGTQNGKEDYEKNRLRTAKVWMDQFAAVAYQIIGWPDWNGSGDVSSMFRLRKNLQCQSFEWFLKNVWPESPLINLEEDLPYGGPIISFEKTDFCLHGGKKNQKIKSLATQRDTSLSATKIPDQNVFQCPWFLYFKRHKSINGAFDEETALRVYRNKVIGFDWNTDGRGDASKWVVTTVRGSDSFDIITIKSQIYNECITINEMGDVYLAKCESNNLSQMWEWFRSDKILRATDFYGKWLAENS